MRFMSSKGSLGTIERPYQHQQLGLSSTAHDVSSLDLRTAKVSKLSDIDGRTSSDKQRPMITGLTYLAPNAILAVDNFNGSLKAVDITTNTNPSQLSFTSRPWDIAVLPGDQAAVTIPSKSMIPLVSTKVRMSLLGFIHVNWMCVGISSTKHNLVV